MKNYLVSFVYLDNLNLSFAAISQATSPLQAISTVLTTHRKSRSHDISIYSLYLNDGSYCGKDLRIFVTEIF